MFVTVYLDQSLQKPLDYAVPKDTIVQVGMRVEVPLKTRTAKGTIATIKTHSSFSEVKEIIRVLSPQGELSASQWKLAEWMSHYYATSLQKVLKCFIPPNIRRDVKEKSQKLFTLAKTHKETLEECSHLRIQSPKQADVLELLLQFPKGVFFSHIKEKISVSALQTLVKKKWIQEQNLPFSDILEEEFFPSSPKTLNEEQEKTLDSIRENLDKKIFSAHLIYGITGSGKTEVYLQAIAKALELGKSAMLLVPEVALTSQTIERFKARFPHKIAILHHKRSLGERTTAWEDLRSGKIQIVVGARSAIFCPIQNLGLIIIDEEHDGSYKQSDEMPCYQGRDVAVMRAHFENCCVILGSATPSIESRYNAKLGKYHLHELRARATKATLPKVHIIDMKMAMERNGGFTHFSSELLNAMKDRLEKGEQTLLLLNKRGFHRMQLCKSCRSIVKCPHCDLSLTFHREANLLKCHFCNYGLPPYRDCPSCHKPELEFKGFGTEHVERSLHAILPNVRTLRMDRDTIQKKHDHEEIFKQFRAHKADVLIGTQMIAKGFHFPSVTLVGILNIDASLTIPDFRSPEHVFQLLIQVAGRAGRAEIPGEVYLQTFMPDHPVIKKAQMQDYDAFYNDEIEERKSFNYPPFSHLAKLTFSDTNSEIAQRNAENAHAFLKKELPSTAQIFPVVPAGHPKIKDLYRFQILIKTPKIGNIANILQNIQGAKIDTDPNSTFF
ncbi:MAG TPA: primosomal protein N' [Chlamydiales bacterium]|nr:primosomal protein N' [Chlamydiales bacterium]